MAEGTTGAAAVTGAVAGTSQNASQNAPQQQAGTQQVQTQGEGQAIDLRGLGEGMKPSNDKESNNIIDDNNTNDEFDLFSYDMEDNDFGDLSEYKFESLENIMQEQGIEMTEDLQIELNKYKMLAKDIGLNTEQFSKVADLFLETIQDSPLFESKQEAENKFSKESLNKMKAQMTTNEKKSYKPLITKLAKNFGEDVAKEIGTNLNVFRAVLKIATSNRKSLDGNAGIFANTTATNKSETDVRTERAEKLRAVLGNQEKVNAVFEEYNKKYPQFFKDNK